MAAPSSPASSSASSSARNAHKPLIYVVEDDSSVAQILQRILVEFDFHVEVFGTAAAVIRRLQSERPDLCIVDLGLPDMDGIELMSHIGRLSSCGLLVVTGRSHTIDRVMGLELGADDYVVKPFEPRELVARVRSILRRRAATGGGGAVKQHGLPTSSAGHWIARPTSCARPMAKSMFWARPKPRCCARFWSGPTRS